MVIVVEGIDRVGKTTLCSRLSYLSGYKILKKDRECADMDLPVDAKTYATYGNAMGIVQMVNGGLAKDFIFDRFHWTEYVYGAIDRGSNLSLSLMNLVEIEMLKAKDNWLMVYVKPADLAKSSIEHGKNLSRHYNMYNKLFENTNLRTVVVNGYEDIDNAIKSITKIVKGIEA